MTCSRETTVADRLAAPQLGLVVHVGKAPLLGLVPAVHHPPAAVVRAVLSAQKVTACTERCSLLRPGCPPSTCGMCGVFGGVFGGVHGGVQTGHGMSTSGLAL